MKRGFGELREGFSTALSFEVLTAVLPPQAGNGDSSVSTGFCVNSTVQGIGAAPAAQRYTGRARQEAARSSLLSCHGL